MGRSISSSLYSSCGNKSLRLCSKIRYFMVLLRKYPRLAKAPLCLDIYQKKLLSSPLNSLSPTRKYAIKKTSCSDTSYCPHSLIRGYTKDTKQLLFVRTYSSSSRNSFKAEAPIGIMEESKSGLNLSSLGGRLSQSFNQLSRHVNIYFRKKKDIAPFDENACLVVTTPDYLGRAQRCVKTSQGRDKTQTLEGSEMSGTAPPTQGNWRPQLFHISALTTTFGESYSYVSHHINSVFSGGSAAVQGQDESGTTAKPRTTHRRHKKRKIQSTYIMNSTDDAGASAKLSADQAPMESKTSGSSWEDGFLQFARHINNYFGAKVTDEVRQNEKRIENSTPTQPTSLNQCAVSQPKQEEQVSPGTTSLFHSSHNTTGFGENHFQMASHINQYFNGQSDLDEDQDGDTLTETHPEVPTPPKTASFMDYLRHPTSAIPDLLGSYIKRSHTVKAQPTMMSPGVTLSQNLTLSQRRAVEVVRALIGGLSQASSAEALTTCVEALNEHLIRYPSCKAILWQERTAVTLLRKRRVYRDDQGLQSALRETLALIGYMDPVKGRGIRVLSIDGGGTRGVVPLQVLKLLEVETGKKIHQLFDYICGVSTGAVLAFMLGLAHFSLEECAEMYRRFGSEVFRQNRLVGTMKMGWSHSYYDTEIWEAILQEKLGHKVLIKTARDELSPKVSAVSAVVNWGTSPKAFVFRNYNHKPGALSRYSGASGCQMWQAVRASSAAPGYFQEFPLQSDIHQDGGIILNNPCALAVHESRLLWPKQPFQCVLSLGTGRYDNAKKSPATSTSLRAKISNLICSATDTEGVHTLLDDLLAPDVYFRFNPRLSAVVYLDESRPQALDQLQRDTQDYLERNRPKLAQLCLVLGAERSAVSRTKDWMSEKAWEMKQTWL